MRKRGFTLVELMVVIAVIAILSTIALFGFQSAQKSGRDTHRLQIVNGLRANLEKSFADNGSYPAGSFSQMMNSLSTAGYVTVMPVDPGCGGGRVTWPTGTVASNGSWSICAGTSYHYVSNGSGYTLSLFKEGGGSTALSNPQ